ncbi:mRNA splicing protein prp28 [Lithohypha guttulata]|uniref:Pre-mRNA-splicing ATP-dependent RNA helicase PRP28 n=1 Tax=Lithohypha guttulata TaxID=1690604 RepID=A0AAN7Y4W6_9EURO|nr:mRNA splicing protein prp28 [Lithohypha guttulata]KAK5082714.1 mRNA splicing protein prp28 [Lithohypha guttulata]KAK5099433.1 mRNA splicing protein prp28 [Lithohypha guttulata]
MASTMMVNGHVAIPGPPVDTDLSPPPPPSDLAPPPPPTEDVAPPPPSDLPPPPPVETTEEDTSLNLGPPKKVKKGWGSKPKSQPLSVEELVKAKREADAAAAKPKFLSKAQREKLALEKRQQEVEQQKSVTNGVTNGHAPSDSRMDIDVKEDRAPVPSGPRSQRNGGPPTGPSSMRSRDGPNRGYDMSPPPAPKPIAFGTSDSKESRGQKRKVDDEDSQAELLRKRYMGQATNVSKFSAQKKRNRTTDKKFNFEWNTEEDTTPDYDPLYRTRADVGLGFGRGRVAGYDDTKAEEAAKKYAAAIAARDKEAGNTRAQEILDMERRRREEGSRTAIDKHWSEKRLDQMRERDWRIFKEDFNIATKGGGLPNPMRNWAESGLPKRLLELVDQVGYTEPSAVQRAAIPIALQARDLIGVAVTGSGKTASFLLPLLVYIDGLPRLDEFEWRRNDGPYALILAPTRELAQQIETEARKFAGPLGYNVVSIVGGHSIEEQAYNLRNGAEIVIATPGRLVDCIERRILVLSQCCYVVMDEADRMIDLGFEEPVNKILDALPVSNEKPDTEEAEDAKTMTMQLGGSTRYRQTMMYSATMPVAVERIARKYLRRPATVTIGNVGEAVDTVEQRVEFVGGEDKRKKRLAEVLRSGEFKAPIIVFVNIKRNCDAVARDIKHMGFSSVTLHGSKTQEQREAALLSVRNGQTDVLVATDLAGRGIDVADVSLVVNFNMANNIESYTHRIGRTGRAGKSGVALTFLGPEDNDVLYDLKQMLMKSPLSRVPEELRKHEAAQQKKSTLPGGSAGKKTASDESGGFSSKGAQTWMS